MLVLVVDDDPIVRRATARIVRQLGYQAWSVDGPTAVAALAETSQLPDVVLSDYDMPGVTGLDVMRAAAAARVPFLFHTGNEQAGLRAGAYVVPKGAPLERLRMALELAIGRR